MKKKILVIALALSLVAVTALGVTLAYFTADATKTNTFTVGNIAINLLETKWDEEGGGKKQGETVYPGEALPKNPKVVSAGTNPCIVRLKVEMPAAIGEVANPVALEGLDAINWYYLDGYYYFLRPIATPNTGYDNVKDIETTSLFTHIRISTAVKNRANISAYNVKVTAQALQAQRIFSKIANMENGISLSEIPINGSKAEIFMVQDAFNAAFPSTTP